MACGKYESAMQLPGGKTALAERLSCAGSGCNEGPAYSGETMYDIQLDDGRECVIEKDSFEVCYDDVLPMWA